MKHRKAFGKKIAQFQHWQFRMAERAIQIENARNLYAKAALQMDQGIEFPEPEAAGAKYYATNCAAEMAREAIQIFGGYGFMRELSHDGSVIKSRKSTGIVKSQRSMKEPMRYKSSSSRGRYSEEI